MRVFSRFHRFADHEQMQLALQRTSVSILRCVAVFSSAAEVLFFADVCE